MVVASAVAQLRIIVANSGSDGERITEIQGRAGDGSWRLRKRNGVGINCEKTVGRDRQPVTEDVHARRSALEIEEAVVGQVDDQLGDPSSP